MTLDLRSPRAAHDRFWLRVGLVAFSLSLAQLLWLKEVHYSTCLISAADPAEVALSPSPDFQIGRLKWPVSELEQPKELTPFRADFQKHCDGKRGLSAALCVSERMMKAFPWGEPRHDFYTRGFDPLTDFAAHIDGGEPGHCVTADSRREDPSGR